jgi:predicted nucleic acid-binding protein
VSAPVYLDTSAVLRAVLESGTTPDLESKIHGASTLVTSRLALVESARVFWRLRMAGAVSEERLADAQREVEVVWARCNVWELTRAVCDLAGQIAPTKSLRSLDALHAATFVIARRRLEGLELVSVDGRLLAAVAGA